MRRRKEKTQLGRTIAVSKKSHSVLIQGAQNGSGKRKKGVKRGKKASAPSYSRSPRRRAKKLAAKRVGTKKFPSCKRRMGIDREE